MSENEIDKMSEVDANPRVHEDSTLEEQALLKKLYGDPNEDGVYV